MTDEKRPLDIYPYNLLIKIKGSSPLELPPDITPDVQAGLQYALSTLPENDQILLKMRYAKNMTLYDVSIYRSLSYELLQYQEQKSLQKLRHPSRWNFIQHRIAGGIRQEAAAHFYNGYQAGYADGYREGNFHQKSKLEFSKTGEDPLTQPISSLSLSPRTYHCLDQAGYLTIGQVVELEREKILSMRGLGKRSMNEVARALQHLKIPSTPWYEFLL